METARKVFLILVVPAAAMALIAALFVFVGPLWTIAIVILAPSAIGVAIEIFKGLRDM